MFGVPLSFTWQAVGWPADCFKDWRYLPPPVVPQKASRFAPSGRGWKDTALVGLVLGYSWLIVDGWKFGRDFRLDRRWKNGRFAFYVKDAMGQYFFLESSFIHLSPLQGGKNKKTKITSFHFKPFAIIASPWHMSDMSSKNRVQIHGSLRFTMENGHRHRKSRCTPARAWRSGRLTYPSQDAAWNREPSNQDEQAKQLTLM